MGRTEGTLLYRFLLEWQTQAGPIYSFVTSKIYDGSGIVYSNIGRPPIGP